MPVEPDDLRAMLGSVVKDAQVSIDRNVTQIKGRFSAHGRFGSGSMRKAIEAAVTDVFRESANTMVGKAGAYAGDTRDETAALVDHALVQLINSLLANYLPDGWDVSLEPELTRLKNDAVRDFLHMPRDVRMGMAVSFPNNQGNINMAVGSGNTANQAVRGTSVGDLAALIGQLKTIIANSQVDEEQRLELQDHVDVLELEAGKPNPDKGKIMRCAKRLLETAEKIGIAAVGSFTTALLKHLGL